MSVDPSFVVAASGAATAVAGVWLSRRGQRDTAEQSKTAAAIADQTLELTTWQSIAADRERELANLRAAYDREIAALNTRLTGASARADVMQDRHDKARERFQEETDRERAQHERSVRDLAHTIAILRSAVLDEAKAEAAKDVVQSVAGIDDIDALIEETTRAPEGEQ